jgi:hypothetical protein
LFPTDSGIDPGGATMNVREKELARITVSSKINGMTFRQVHIILTIKLKLNMINQTCVLTLNAIME